MFDETSLATYKNFAVETGVGLGVGVGLLMTADVPLPQPADSIIQRPNGAINNQALIWSLRPLGLHLLIAFGNLEQARIHGAGGN